MFQPRAVVLPRFIRKKLSNNFHVMFTLDILKSEVTECTLKQTLLADLTKIRDIFKGKWIRNFLEKPCRNCGHPPEGLPSPHLDLNAGNSLSICLSLQSQVSRGTASIGKQILNGKLTIHLGWVAENGENPLH